jgi:hypothetical protein
MHGWFIHYLKKSYLLFFIKKSFVPISLCTRWEGGRSIDRQYFHYQFLDIETLEVKFLSHFGKQ